MNPGRARNLIALLSGVLFGSGLLLSGMTRPAKVLGFLDVFGAFDPSLLFVMAGAIIVFGTAFRLSRLRTAPVLDERFHAPPERRIDAKLVLGAAVFGAGWGLSGYCPGPSIVALPAGGLPVLLFVACLLVGSFGAGLLEKRLQR